MPDEKATPKDETVNIRLNATDVPDIELYQDGVFLGYRTAVRDIGLLLASCFIVVFLGVWVFGRRWTF